MNESAKEAARRLAKSMLVKGYLPEALHQYTDEAGNALYWVIRLRHPKGDKCIRPMRLDGDKYILSAPKWPNGKPLYNLHNLAKHPSEPVIFVEGEWCVDKLTKIGVLATTTGSADSAGKADLRPLAGRPVDIWADNDDAGKRYADDLENALLALGCTVRRFNVALLNLPLKGDVVNWLAAHPEATAADIHQLPTSDPLHFSYLASDTGKLKSSPFSEGSSTSTTKFRQWQEPKPIQAPLRPVPAFDAEALLPESLRTWIMDEAERMPCPVDFIAAAVLVSLGSLIGARCAIKPKAKDSWTIVPNVWGGSVGLPSAKKSPAIGVALKPLDLIIAKSMQAYQSDVENFETDKTVFEAQDEALEGSVRNAAKEASKKVVPDDKKVSAEIATIAPTPDPEKKKLDAAVKELKDHRKNVKQQAPVLRRYKTNDTTIEKLGEMLQENPAGLLVVRDELVGLLASWDRSGHEGDRAFYLEAWNGNSSFDTDRIGRGSIHIPNLCVSIFGGIQPDKLTRYLEQASDSLANDGMLQRFQILVYPDPQLWEWRDRTPDKAARNKAFAIFDALVDFDPVIWGASAADDLVKLPHFYFDKEAQEIFVKFSGNLHQVKLPVEDQPIIAQHLTKFDKLFPAIALILHIVDCAATGRNDPVSAEAARFAKAWCIYLEAHARRCYGLLIDDGLRSAQALAEKIREAKLSDGFTARDVRRNQWRYLTSEEAVQAALEWLEEEFWLQSEEIGGAGPGTGRPSRRYYVNPQLEKLKGGVNVMPIGSLETEKSECLNNDNHDTANTDDRLLTAVTAVTAVPHLGKSRDSHATNDSNGST